MDERKDIEPVKSETAPVAPEAVETKAAATPDLPVVEAPSISPAGPLTPEPVASEPVIAPVAEAAPTVEPAATTDAAPEPVAEPAVTPIASHPRFVLRARHKRYAALAASVVLAAVIGAVAGSIAGSGSAPPPPKPDVAAIEENKALQQSVARLAKEVTTLKANLDASSKSAKSQIAKLNDRLAREAEVTGSISAPDTTAPATAPAQQALAPVPTPRPAPRFAAVEPPAPARTPVVAGWSIRDTRGGYIYVEGNGGIFQVVPGAPLPGLGPVESIKRLDGRWVVLTPRGMIVSTRDRHYFE